VKRKDNKEWSQVIKPNARWFDLKLRELWDYRDLIAIFVKRDIVQSYKQTILGPLWLFLGPVFTVIAFTFVFSEIAKIQTDNIPAPLFYLAGTTMWNYFSACFSGTSSTFVTNSSIFGKVYFPRLIAPIAVIFSNLMKLGIQMLMFLCFFGYYYTRDGSDASYHLAPNSSLFFIPLLVILMGGISLGMGLIISAVTTKYRDMSYFISFGVTLLMYATPVIYPTSQIPLTYRPILAYNPIAPIIEAFRYGFTGSGTFTLSGLLYSSLFMVIVLVTGAVLFNRTEKTFMDTV
jgi:lipopolysaccharide transport system permease protein